VAIDVFTTDLGPDSQISGGCWEGIAEPTKPEAGSTHFWNHQWSSAFELNGLGPAVSGQDGPRNSSHC